MPILSLRGIDLFTYNLPPRRSVRGVLKEGGSVMRRRAPANVLRNNTQSPPDCPCTSVLAFVAAGGRGDVDCTPAPPLGRNRPCMVNN